jgi:hypothetical protein
MTESIVRKRPELTPYRAKTKNSFYKSVLNNAKDVRIESSLTTEQMIWAMLDFFHDEALQPKPGDNLYYITFAFDLPNYELNKAKPRILSFIKMLNTSVQGKKFKDTWYKNIVVAEYNPNYAVLQVQMFVNMKDATIAKLRKSFKHKRSDNRTANGFYFDIVDCGRMQNYITGQPYRNRIRIEPLVDKAGLISDIIGKYGPVGWCVNITDKYPSNPATIIFLTETLMERFNRIKAG